MRPALLAGFIALVSGCVAGWMLVVARDELASRRAASEAAWTELGSAFERRAELIPRVVGAAWAAAGPARQLLDEVEAIRRDAAAARDPEERLRLNTQLDSSIYRLLVAPEAWSGAGLSLLRLKDELAESENRIALARRKYNEAVQRYNASIQQFPNNLAAWLFGFERNDRYYKTEPATRTGPKVNPETSDPAPQR